MKKTINTFIATLNLIAVFIVISAIGYLAFEKASLPDGNGEYFMNHLAYAYSILLLLPFLLFAIPAILVVFFKKNSTILLVFNFLGVAIMICLGIFSMWENL